MAEWICRSYITTNIIEDCQTLSITGLTHRDINIQKFHLSVSNSFYPYPHTKLFYFHYAFRWNHTFLLPTCLMGICFKNSMSPNNQHYHLKSDSVKRMVISSWLLIEVSVYGIQLISRQPKSLSLSKTGLIQNLTK